MSKGVVAYQNRPPLSDKFTMVLNAAETTTARVKVVVSLMGDVITMVIGGEDASFHSTNTMHLPTLWPLNKVTSHAGASLAGSDIWMRS